MSSPAFLSWKGTLPPHKISTRFDVALRTFPTGRVMSSSLLAKLEAASVDTVARRVGKKLPELASANWAPCLSLPAVQILCTPANHLHRRQAEAAQPDGTEADRSSDWWYQKGIFSDNVTRLTRAESDTDVDVGDDDGGGDDDCDDGETKKAALQRCEDCGAVCTSGAHKLRHRCDRNFKCGRMVGGVPCGWQGRARLLLRAHELEVHCKPHVCVECNARFANLQSLRRHAPMHAVATSTCACNACGVLFNRPSNLARHRNQCRDRRPNPAVVSILDTGADTKPFLCKLCLATFWMHRDVRRHVETAHTLKYDFKCDVCVSSFRSKRNLSIHMKVHSVPRPFRCSVCFMRFGIREELMEHLQVHLMPSSAANSGTVGVDGLMAATIKQELGEDVKRLPPGALKNYVSDGE